MVAIPHVFLPMAILPYPFCPHDGPSKTTGQKVETAQKMSTYPSCFWPASSHHRKGRFRIQQSAKK